MNDAVDHPAYLHLDPQFLLQFTPKALWKGFSGLALAPRKLPQSTQMGLRVTLGDKKFPPSKNQTCGNLDHLPTLL